MINKKVKCLLLILSLLLPDLVSAQCRNVFEARQKMNQLVMLENANGGLFLKEINNLKIDSDQYIINHDTVTVGLLVLNDSPTDRNKHDYSAYWKGKNQTSGRYTWVFVLDDFKNRCKMKDIDSKKYDVKSGALSKRLCQFLGLSDTDRRDTLVYMRVLAKKLFRPSYNTDIKRRTTQAFAGNNDYINLDINNRLWMSQQQFSNTYPWTRMGYTYDWGEDDYIGVTEFILEPNTTFVSKPNYYVVGDYLK
ncbi:hypothetical protein prwr041_21720 [Prevotella herbatica]|uniref:Uncharacterized protein n=1 Tax=Prevotella herbatica TaxID=2801997 RepID=A0ABM7P0I3_9BACT|nr:hypothetical protein [Prevotella herbatica]BCS86279.1 hypothetical protein prwr041_21720 [Prevotella herbatica]